jgi:hypothetical protein
MSEASALGTQREVMWLYGVSASEINAFLGRVISPILSLRMLKSYALGSVGVNDKVCVPLGLLEI